MHDRVRRQRQTEATQKLQECAKRVGAVLGIEDAEDKVIPVYPGKIRRDPMAVQMYDIEALTAFFEEAAEKLESLEVAGNAPVTSLEELKGVSDDTKLKLYHGGIYSLEDLRGASEEDLTAVKGIGPAKAADLKEQAQVGAR